MSTGSGTGRQPPINEVALALGIVPQPALAGPLLSEILGPWFDDHSQVQVAPPYEMPAESSMFAGLVPGPAFRIVENATPHRYWLISRDDSEVTQIQPDYVALNWRRRQLSQEYVGYESMRDRFGQLLDQLHRGIQSHGGELRPVRAEITYINAIQPNALWSEFGHLHRLFAVQVPGAEPYERVQTSYTRRLDGEGGEFTGRLHVTLQPGYEWMKQEPQVTLQIVVRSADLQEQSVEAGLSFLDLAHRRANAAFLELLTPEARRMWGLS